MDIRNTKTFSFVFPEKKVIKNKMIIVKNKAMKPSLLPKMFIRILFFPFFLLRWYFRLLKQQPKKWFFLTFGGLSAIFLYLMFCLITLPKIEKLSEYKPVLSSKFYDRNGEKIFEVGNERREYVEFDKIPKMLVYAFISAEDKTFYTNSGVDFVGLGRTILQDAVKFLRRQRLAGASTITQQVVKNVLLTNEYSITRKIKELILSYRVAKQLPKDKIMEVYLNHIYLGNQAYGVSSAALEYFGKTLAQLTVPEMALLAAMPKAPSAINPFKNYKRALVRRNYVLQRMLEDGYIKQEQYETYSNAEIVVKKRYNFYYPFYAPMFFAQSLLTAKETKLSKENVLNDGYIVNLTLDSKIQKLAQKALNDHLERYSKNHGFEGAIFSFTEEAMKDKKPAELLRSIDEPENIGKFLLALVLKVEKDKVKVALKDGAEGFISINDMLWAKQKIYEVEKSDVEIKECGQVLKVGDVVVVGKKTNDGNYYSLEQLPRINGGVLVLNPRSGEVLAMVGGYNDLAGSFNRSVQAFRQLGSIVKPFIYGTALEKGYTPTSIFMDADVNINIGDGIIWTPENDSKTTRGPMTLRRALELSRNTVTVRLASEIGLKSVRKAIRKAKINDSPDTNLSVALGSVESSLLKIATAFSAFVNDGVMPKTYMISSVKNILDKKRIIDLTNEDEEQLVAKSAESQVGMADKNIGKNNNSNSCTIGKIFFSDCDANSKCLIELEDLTKKGEKTKDLGGGKEMQGNNIENSLKNTNFKQKNNENQDTADEEEEKIEGNIDEANNGLIDKMNVHKIFSADEEKRRIFSPQTAYQILNILQGAVLHGTSRRLAGMPMPISSKTGTSNGGKDMWNVVMTPELLIVAFMGYDTPMDTNNYGGQYALPISKDILMGLYNDRYSFGEFKTPDGVVFAKVNRNTGRPTEDDENAVFEVFKETDDISAETKEEEIDITDIDG